MANFKKHSTTGAIVGAFTGLFLNFHQQTMRLNNGEQDKIYWFQLLGYSAGGSILGSMSGILPDILEPAINPNHRKFFHSWTMGIAVAFGLYKTHRSNLPNEVKAAITVAGAGYLSHQALDSSTPKGLPLV